MADEAVVEATPEQDGQAILELTGAAGKFGIGAEVEVGEIHFKVRAPTNPEVALWGEINRKHEVEEAMTEGFPGLQGGRSSAEEKALQREYSILITDKTYLEAKEKRLKKDEKEIERINGELASIEEKLVRASAKTRREQFAWKRLDTLSEEIDALEAVVLKGGATDDQQETLDGHYVEHERLQGEIDHMQVKGQIKALKSMEKIYSASDKANTEMLWHIAKADHEYEGSLEDFEMATRSEKQGLEDLIAAMGFQHPLSVASRLGRGTSGTAVTSRRSRRAARKKTG